MTLQEMLAKDREDRMAEIKAVLKKVFNTQYEMGNQLPVPVTTKEGDEPAMHRMMAEFEAEGIKMTYHFDDRLSQKEYVLIWAHQPKRKA